MDFIYKDLTYKILGAAMDVHNELGCGFLEKVYENSLCIRLKELKLHTESQKAINVIFHDVKVGEYFADIVVENKVILELKTVRKIDEIHEAQILNYLKATGFRIGYILNFANRKLEHRRFVL